MQSDNLLLSIIVPVYNVENYLTFCIDSIFNQGLDIKDFEVLLIDDGSKDNSYQVCLDLQMKYPNIRVFRQENYGQSIARNKGINESNGYYLYFVDSDDYLLLNGISSILELALENDYDFVGFRVERTSERRTEKAERKINIMYKGNGAYLLSQHNYNNGPWWYIYKKEKFANFYFIPNRLCEDGLFTTQLLISVENGIIVENVIYQYVDSPNSTVNTKNRQRQAKLRDDMFLAAQDFNKLIESLDKNDDNYNLAYKRLSERQESYMFFALVRSLRTQEDLKSVSNKLKNASKAYPIKSFDGYNSKTQKMLICIFNHKFLFYPLQFVNNKLKIIK
ncbi:glycosyltransferase [Moraxella sp. PS-22]|uniref:Glycosyltransferase n=1 Tax=Moraxella tetraodonis TaxID=2767221 RepID=A0A9X1URP7_9GAMM|nr:glycosyltransferase [Moraxella tetraodonis]MCG8147759.1 glycosyltransferase [Moraxella tetraodonis]